MRNIECDKDDCKHNFSTKCEYPISQTLHLSNDCCGFLKCEEYEPENEELKIYLNDVKKLAEEQERIGKAMCDKMLKDKEAIGI
jgi:hypothetical protein